ncbi:hypothetical protein DNH61_11845 [Paenibacillus sambharensis]|uniref:Uncharacterized protein n=1 Tax=Paenibacillus sambharensis TaxID=1803190 RepID=A0A2W1LK11_9BACL|nr:hypothetical protein DNH61_11845 [Paenibacillus sambharensis]
MSNEKFLATFEKDKDYKRIHVNGVITNYHKNMVTIDLFEEHVPLMTRFTMEDNGPIVEHEEGNLRNYIHASLNVAPENLPMIIRSLEAIYQRYLDERRQSGDGV